MSQPTHPAPRGDQDPLSLEDPFSPEETGDNEASTSEAFDAEQAEFEEDDDEVSLVSWEASDDNEGWDT